MAEKEERWRAVGKRTQDARTSLVPSRILSRVCFCEAAFFNEVFALSSREKVTSSRNRGSCYPRSLRNYKLPPEARVAASLFNPSGEGSLFIYSEREAGANEDSGKDV